MLIRNLFVLSMGLFLLAGCGGSSSGDAAPTVPPAPVPVTITGFQINPGDIALDLDEVAELSAIALMSDASQQAVSATWSSLTPAVAAPSASPATIASVTGLTEGTTTIEAVYAGWHASIEVSVSWSIPAQLGTVYGADPGTGMMKYTGSAAPTSFCAMAPTTGTAISRDNAYGYTITDLGGASGYALHRVDLVTAAQSSVATFPSDSNANLGLDVDSQGRVYTQGYGSGAVHRYDPATGIVTTVGNSGGFKSCLAIGADDRPYYASMWSFGGAWITRHDLGTGALTTWANAPAALLTQRNNSTVPGGFAVNRLGEAYIIDMNVPDIYRYMDLNGDGDALDGGEEVLYGTVPVTDMFERYALGMTATHGGGVAVNIVPDWGTENLGIFWVIDKDRSGTAAGEDEVTNYNTQFVYSQWPSGIIANR